MPSSTPCTPSGAILFRSCRGGYAHSVVLSHAAMDTDAQTLAAGILLTADVSYLKALMEVRKEIVAAGYSPSAEVPTPWTWTRRSKSCWCTNCAADAARGEHRAKLAQPRLNRVRVRRDIGGRFDGAAAEQLSRASQQRPNFVELLLQRRISHAVTLPRARHRHNSLDVRGTRSARMRSPRIGVTAGGARDM